MEEKLNSSSLKNIGLNIQENKNKKNNADQIIIIKAKNKKIQNLMRKRRK